MTSVIRGHGPELAHERFHCSGGLGSLSYMSAREGCSLDTADAVLGFHSLL